jgi:hypothetical protein
VRTFFGRDQLQFGNDGRDFADLTLPPGQYLIWATVPITNTDPDPQSWHIALRASDGAAVVGGATGRLVSGEESSSQVVPILAVVTTSSQPTTVTFRGFGFNIGMFPGDSGKTCSIAAMPAQFV